MMSDFYCFYNILF